MKKTMWCIRFVLLCLLVSTVTLMVSSAPSEKRAKSKNKRPSKSGELVQLTLIEPLKRQSESDQNDENDWYPTIELKTDAIDNDEYPVETASEQKDKIKTTNFEEQKKTVIKTESSKGGKSEQSLNGLVVTTKSIVDENDRIDKNEVKRLRELIAEIAKKIDELQQSLKNDCGKHVKSKNKEKVNNVQTAKRDIRKVKTVKTKPEESKSKNDINNFKGVAADSSSGTNVKGKPQPTQGPITEIEETHTVERKIMKKPKGNKNGMPAVVEKTEIIAKVRPKPIFASTTSSPPEVAILSESLESIQTETVDVKKDPSDVNYNGGINRHMDDLKRQYPDGYWPNELDEGDNDSNESKNSTEISEEDYYEEDYGAKEPSGEELGNDVKVINIKEEFIEKQKTGPSST